MIIITPDSDVVLHATVFLISESAIGGSESCKLLPIHENTEKHGKM
jgi:hypothetical protein